MSDDDWDLDSVVDAEVSIKHTHRPTTAPRSPAQPRAELGSLVGVDESTQLQSSTRSLSLA